MNKGLVSLLAGMAIMNLPQEYQRIKAKELDDGIAKDAAEEKRRRRAERNLRNLKGHYSLSDDQIDEHLRR